MLHVMGQKAIFPAIMVGYEVQSFIDNQKLVDKEYELAVFDDKLPNWIFQVDNQVGGDAVYPMSVLGCLLSFENNQAKAKQGLTQMKSFFHSEIPGKLSDPNDTKLVFTDGGTFNPFQLQILQQYLDTAFDLPRLVSGCEAFVRFEVCDPLTYFSQWKLTGLSLQDGTQTCSQWPPEPRRSQTATYVRDFDDLTVEQNKSFDRDVLQQLLALQPYGCNDAPAIFMLWKNCD